MHTAMHIKCDIEIITLKFSFAFTSLIRNKNIEKVCFETYIRGNLYPSVRAMDDCGLADSIQVLLIVHKKKLNYFS